MLDSVLLIVSSQLDGLPGRQFSSADGHFMISSFLHASFFVFSVFFLFGTVPNPVNMKRGLRLHRCLEQERLTAWLSIAATRLEDGGQSEHDRVQPFFFFFFCSFLSFCVSLVRHSISAFHTPDSVVRINARTSSQSPFWQFDPVKFTQDTTADGNEAVNGRITSL